MTVQDPPKAGRREWLVLAVLVLPTLLVTMDLNVLVLALPRISSAFHAGPVAQLWITDIYAFMVAGLTVTMGHVGDRFGRKKVLLLSCSVFVVASTVCAFSTSVPMLVVTRAVLGASGSAFAPLTLAIIVATFKNPKQMSFAIGVWASALAGGVVLGPPVGGILLHSFWWGSVFLIAIPMMAVVLLAGPFILKESRNPHGGPIDLRSVVLFLLAILPLVGALKQIARTGFGVLPAVLLVVGAVGVTLFVRRQSRIPNPLIDLSLFKDKIIRSGMAVFVTGGLWSGALSLVIAMYLQLVREQTVLAAGLLLLPAAFIGMVCNMIAPKFANVFKPAHVVAGGLLIAMLGALTLTLVQPLGGVVIVVVGMTLVMIGSSPIGPVTNHVVMSSIQMEKAGAVGGLVSTGGELGVAIGVAAMGSVAAGVYTGNVTVPHGVPAAAAASAHNGITGAVAVAPTLPAAQGNALLDSAHAAFTTGLVTVSVIAAVGYVIVATVAWRGMRHVLPFGAGQEAPAGDDTGGAPDPDADRAAA